MDNSTLSLEIPAICGRAVVARFDGGDMSSDGGLLLLAQADHRLGVVDALAKSVDDRRQAAKVRHSVATVLRERIFGIACGYEDANDLDHLREDPMLKIACNQAPSHVGVLASQPTVSRMENSVGKRALYKMGMALARGVVAQLPKSTKCVTIDVDATDDPCHGQQEFEFFNKHYDAHCYLPLLIHITGDDGCQRLLTSLLRPGNASYAVGLFGLLRRAVKLLRSHLPDVRIMLRADGGFGNADVIAFCEKLGLTYALGLPTNKRLAVLSTPVQIDAALKSAWEGEGCREYAQFEYKAKTWPHRRRVVTKVEITQGKINPRYVVTNLDLKPEDVYLLYCKRGDQENRIKEMKLDLCSGRTSCHRFLANQFRLLLHVAAYVLMHALRCAAKGTKWADAQAGTLRHGLMKIAVRVVQTSRKIWIHLPTTCPAQGAWEVIQKHLLLPDG